MDLDVVVHIGQPKAGSTSIQKTLLESTEALEAQGAFYLGLMCERAPGEKRPWQHAEGWNDLVAPDVATARKELGDVVVRSVRRLSEAGYRRAIWSNETILGNPAVVLPALRRLEDSGARIKVVAYIRRPDTWAQSAYLQWGIKHKVADGPLLNFREWLAGRHKRVSQDLQPWLEVPEVETLVRNFDACEDVVADFLRCCDLDPGDFESRRGNETPNSVAMALWAIYNGQFDEPVHPMELGRHLNRSGVLDRAPREIDISSLIWTDEDIADLWRESEPDRDAINGVFRDAGQPEFPDEQRPAKELEVTQDQLNAAMLLLIKNQGDQIHALRKQLRRLQRKGAGDPGGSRSTDEGDAA